jgi:PPK2 family polyphosphate:nucleotide phosphotransferase
MNHKDFFVPEGKQIKLANYDANFTGNYLNKETGLADLDKAREKIIKLQEVMYAQKVHALLVIFQAMDAAGKDSTVKHVFTGLNPQGLQTAAFNAPTAAELDHDFLWRASKVLPERGKIGLFSRSYYEEVLVVRVHPEILAAAPLPEKIKSDKRIWDKRLEDIRNYEKYLTNNGVSVLKFFINISKDEQKQQFMERIEDPAKHWKFSFGDLADREHWDDYMRAYEAMFAATSTEFAPWYIVPGNKRWFTRATIARIIAEKLESLDLKYPQISEKQKQQIEEARKMLADEK